MKLKGGQGSEVCQSYDIRYVINIDRDILYIFLFPLLFSYPHFHPRTSISFLYFNFLDRLPHFLPVITQSLLELKANSFILSTIFHFLQKKTTTSFISTKRKIQNIPLRICIHLSSPSLPVSLPSSPLMISLSQSTYVHPPQRSTSP